MNKLAIIAIALSLVGCSVRNVESTGEVFVLPDGIFVGCGIISIPDNLTFGGSVELNAELINIVNCEKKTVDTIKRLYDNYLTRSGKRYN